MRLQDAKQSRAHQKVRAERIGQIPSGARNQLNTRKAVKDLNLPSNQQKNLIKNLEREKMP